MSGLRVGDLVVAPFAWADNTCDFCREGLHTSCRHGGFWGGNGVGGGQAEAIRVPQAQGTLVPLPVGENSALLPSLLTLSDVLGTGHHVAVAAGVSERTTATVIGDGAVGLMAVLSAKRLGAERIILMGRHTTRTDLGVEFGATDVVAERGEEGIAKVRELTGGDGTQRCSRPWATYLPTGRPSASCARAVGSVAWACRSTRRPRSGFGSLFGRHITLTGGPAPVRAYIEELLPDVLEGTIEPGKVFDRTVTLDEVPDGYRAMDDREALKVLVRP